MPNYLTKEEIRQWRSSLEKITLEEFAARLGKEVEESKPTSSNTNISVNDGFSKIAERAFERERQISHTPFSINRKELLSKSKNQAAPKKSAKEDLVVEKTEPALIEKSNSVLEKVEEFSAKTENNLYLITCLIMLVKLFLLKIWLNF